MKAFSISAYLCTIEKILALALPMSGATIITLIAVLINCHILGAKNSWNLYLLALYIPVNYYLISIYEMIKSCVIVMSSRITLLDEKTKNLSSILTLMITSIILLLISGVVFYFLWRYNSPLKGNIDNENYCYFVLSMMGSSVFVCCFNIVNSFYCGMQKKKFSFLLTAIAASLSCILTALFTNYFKWPIINYAISTSISYSLVSIYAFFRLKSDYKIHFNQFIMNRSSLIFTFRLIKLIGFPVWSSYLILLASLVITNHILMPFGQAVLSAYGLAYRVQSFIFFPGIALGTAIAILVNQHHAQNEKILADNTLKSGALLSIAVYLLIALLCFVFKKNIMLFFTRDMQIVTAGVEYFSYCALTYFALGPIIIYGVAMEQIGYGLRSFFVNAIYFISFTLIGSFFAHYFNNYHYFYLSIAVDNLMIFFLVCFIFFGFVHSNFNMR
jgi:Na+-driven multidrug efflux pump